MSEVPRKPCPGCLDRFPLAEALEVLAAIRDNAEGKYSEAHRVRAQEFYNGLSAFTCCAADICWPEDLSTGIDLHHRPGCKAEREHRPIQITNFTQQADKASA
jgi:hypothetical protein